MNSACRRGWISIALYWNMATPWVRCLTTDIASGAFELHVSCYLKDSEVGVKPAGIKQAVRIKGKLEIDM